MQRCPSKQNNATFFQICGKNEGMFSIASSCNIVPPPFIAASDYRSTHRANRSSCNTDNGVLHSS